MDFHIQKNTSVSIHEQLVTQIAMQIASGLIRPGEKLPSIRALSKRLGIHHNTCLAAYKELDDNGLIDIRHGSGARVAVLDQENEAAFQKLPELSELETLSEFYVRQILTKGYRWEEALASLEAARSHLSQHVKQPLVFVDLHADILPLFQAELQHALQRKVKALALEKVDPDLERNSHFIVSRYHCQALRDKLKSAGYDDLTDRMTLIDVGSGQQELSLIKQMPADSLAVVFSRSTIVLQQAEAVVKALRGDDIILRPMHPSQESMTEIQRVLKRAQLIFADFICTPHLDELTRKPVHTIRVIPDKEMDKLKAFKA